MAFKDVHLFSPIIHHGMSKDHPHSLAYKRWWEEQRHRCIHGYKIKIGGKYVQITGRHYFYLNFWKIRGYDPKSNRKTLIAPRFTELDYDYFWAIEDAFKNDKNFIVLKRRQIGASEKAAAIIGHEFSFFTASQSIITAGEDKYAAGTMWMTRRGLNNLAETEFFKNKSPNTPEYVQAKYKVKENGKDKWKGSLSEIYAFTSNGDPQSLIGKQPSLVYFEEAGKFPGVQDTYKYIQPALEAEGHKTGYAIIVGTGGDMEKGAAELEEMFYNPDLFDLYPFENTYDDRSAKIGFFIPGYRFHLIDKEGNDMVEESKAALIAEREKLKPKPHLYFNEITQRPFDPAEAFLITGNSYFPIAIINKRLGEIKRSAELIAKNKKYRLSWKYNEKHEIIGVDMTQDDFGDFLILEPPEYNDGTETIPRNMYYAGTDSYDKDDAPTSTSKFSISIIKGVGGKLDTNKKFVARYTGRPSTAKMAYEKSAMLCYLYNAQNLIEWSNILIFSWYEEHNFTYYLAERPSIVYSNMKFSRVNNRFGVDPNTKDDWLQLLRDYVITNIDNIDDIELLERLAKFVKDPKYNCDITIAAALANLNMEDSKKVEVRMTEEEKVEFMHYRRSANGTFDLKFYKN